MDKSRLSLELILFSCGGALAGMLLGVLFPPEVETISVPSLMGLLFGIFVGLAVGIYRYTPDKHLHDRE